MTNDEALKQLRIAHPWPDKHPDARSVEWGWDAGGKHLVIEQIKRNAVEVVIEIGVMLGASAKVWLETSPNVVVIAVDPWLGGVGLEATRRESAHRWQIEQLTRQPDGLYETFLANMWEYRERLIPIRGMAPEALYGIAQTGLRPDLIYLDADKSGRELDVCHTLFPNAILTGDDWFWGTDRLWNPDDGYPIRKPVKEFCRRHQRHLLVDKSTWVISETPPSWHYRLLVGPRYQMKSIRRRARGAWRNMIGQSEAA